jgi:hypothetical protein
MNHQPPELLAAVVVLVVEGIGAIGWSALMIVVVAALGGSVAMVAAMTILGAFGFGIVALAAAIGAWRRRSWSWLVGTTLQAVVLLGVVIAALSGGWHPALLVAIALALTGAAALSSPATRRALGV